MLPGNSATHLAPASRPVPPEPIAIVGMACRFPGAPGLDEFWQLLRDGRDETTEIRADRLDVEAFYDSRPGTPGKTRSRWGGLIQDVEGFDAAFSGISPREAVNVDPQQRLVMEVAQEAMEGVGEVPEQLAGSDTGVFVGGSSNDYEQLVGGDASQIDSIYMITGNARSISAGRLSANIGHTEAAAGIAGLIKTALSLHHRAIPASPHAAELSPAIDWDEIPCRLALGRRQREVNRRAARVPPGLHSIAAHRRRPSRDLYPSGEHVEVRP
jgi:acyl transferase domain-containing protein